jgi:hypothetical protein
MKGNSHIPKGSTIHCLIVINGLVNRSVGERFGQFTDYVPSGGPETPKAVLARQTPLEILLRGLVDAMNYEVLSAE